MPLDNFPLISCIMSTNNRRPFISYAIAYFLQQDYENKELLIVDDGTDCIEDLIPANEQIRYIRLDKKMTLGEKRNFCIKESKGDLIMHWDDDDWMAPYRISYQVSELLKNNTEICGLQQMYFREIATGKCWLYKYPAHAQPWLAGGSLLYKRNFWQTSPFPDMQVASDTRFIFTRKLMSYTVLTDYNFYVASIHGNNTSAKHTKSSLWQPVELSVVEKIVNQYPLHNSVHKINNDSVLNKPSDGRTKIAILITTCNRPHLLNKMIDGLKQEQHTYDLDFFIIDDGTLCNRKKLYWKTVNNLWQQIRNKTFDYYFQLPDDFELNNNFISKAIAAWGKISDDKKICLNLVFDGHRFGKTCWTNFWPQLQLFGGTRYLLTQWTDMMYICEKRFFEELSYTIHPIHPSRWTHNPKLSSAVGQQISTRLHGKGLHLYQVTQNEAEHIGDNSIINPEVRKIEPIKAATLPLIYAGMASIPEREELLKKAIATVIPYLDRLFLFLNDYKQVPSWISRFKNITPLLSIEENTNKGDAGKFFGLSKIKENDFYYFTLDDDMIYPPDYTWKMIHKIEVHQRKAIVGFGGYIMKPFVNHFYNDRDHNWHISQPNTTDRFVHILHTCLTAWHSSAIEFRFEDCQKANMGDLWLAIAAQKQMVPMILAQRPDNWVKNQPIPLSQTIYGRYRNYCTEQTNVFNSWQDWKIVDLHSQANLLAEGNSS